MRIVVLAGGIGGASSEMGGASIGTDYGGQMAASVLFSLPVVIFVLIIQRNLVAGMSAGAVKG